ncbi:hypothetical protein [Trinickia dinghuensis]|uniref:Uncharacterized protein n=1 Tax=Trinickia dinghuensis TaxID=2291023 RepID=A0A3D8JZL8_9BURK|nr:hypothetical protein [Trinickia dinghuensis]RDU98096.1 hypothetical protein DWV00_16410 [Trinickia dinghuensis]
MDGRVNALIARMDAAEIRSEERERRMDEKFDAFCKRFEERNKLFDEQLKEQNKLFDGQLQEQNKRFDERWTEQDKRFGERYTAQNERFDMFIQRADAALERTSHLTTHLWMAASTIIIAVCGMVVGAYYAAQSSHLGMTQTVISAFQQGQQTPIRMKD